MSTRIFCFRKLNSCDKCRALPSLCDKCRSTYYFFTHISCATSVALLIFLITYSLGAIVSQAHCFVQQVSRAFPLCATCVARFPSFGDTYSRLGNGKAISRGTFSVPRLFSCARYIFRTSIRFLCARYVFRTSIVFVREVRIPYLAWFFVREVCIPYLDWFFVCEVRIPYLDCFCARGTVSVPRLGFCIRGTDSVPRLVLCTRYGFRTSIGFLCEVYGGYLGVLFMSDEDCAGYTWVKYVYLIV